MADSAHIHDDLKQYSLFLSNYATCLLGAGVHTTRIIRNTCRIAAALGVKAEMMVMHKNINLTLYSMDGQHVYNQVAPVAHRPISFRINTALSKLSWDAYDNHYSIDELWQHYNEILNAPKINDWVVMVLVGFANAAFCGIFGGDWWACLFVGIDTWIGYSLKILMLHKKINTFGVWFTCAFTSSMIAAMCGWLHLSSTTDIAVAASALYLVPGVPLINSIIDTIEGHVLTGLARFIDAVLLIGSMALGLLCTTIIMG